VKIEEGVCAAGGGLYGVFPGRARQLFTTRLHQDAVVRVCPRLDAQPFRTLIDLLRTTHLYCAHYSTEMLKSRDHLCRAYTLQASAVAN